MKEKQIDHFELVSEWRMWKSPPALDMHRHVLLHIKQGLEACQRAFSPIIIIEDQYLQTFVHTLPAF